VGPTTGSSCSSCGSTILRGPTRNACGRERAPGYLIGDRDGCYGNVFIRRLGALGVRDHPTAPRSPWQNGYAERLIGSIRRECLDHVVVCGERHLHHVLSCYVEYYNATRTHLSLFKDIRWGASCNQLGALNANLFLVACTTNMREFYLRQAQARVTTQEINAEQATATDLRNDDCECRESEFFVCGSS
jgi:transposase InsO family protein